MQLFKHMNYDFMGKRYWFLSTSLFLIFISIAALVYRKGPVLGIDFTGGTVLQIEFKQLPPIDKVRDALSKAGFVGFGLQTQPSNHNLIIRVKSGEKSEKDISAEVMGVLKANFADTVANAPSRVEFIGSVIGKNIIFNTFLAIFGSFILIIIYVAFRFDNWIWGLAGVLALVHDVFISFGLMTLLGREITLEIVAALLTLAGYSINDTIVLFDRVRENLRNSRKETPLVLYNRSINETMSRTINTSLTVLMSALALLVFGGDVIHDFSLVFSFGVVIGSYSTIGVALALVYEIQQRRKSH